MTEQVTPERIAEIRARAKAATKGPWYVHHDSFAGRTSVSTWAAPITERVACNIAGPMVHRADAEFIGHAPDDIRDLLLALDAATAERDRLRTALAGLVGATDRAELEAMEAAVRMMSAPAEDKARSIDAIHALLATVRA